MYTYYIIRSGSSSTLMGDINYNNYFPENGVPNAAFFRKYQAGTLPHQSTNATTNDDEEHNINTRRVPSRCPGCGRLFTLQEDGNKLICAYYLAGDTNKRQQYSCGYTSSLNGNIDDSKPINYQNNAPGTKDHYGASLHLNPINGRSVQVQRTYVGPGRMSKSLQFAIMKSSQTDYWTRKRQRISSAISDTLSRLKKMDSASGVLNDMIVLYEKHMTKKDKKESNAVIISVLAERLVSLLTTVPPNKVRETFIMSCVTKNIITQSKADQILQVHSKHLKSYHGVVGKVAQNKESEARISLQQLDKDIMQLLSTLGVPMRSSMSIAQVSHTMETMKSTDILRKRKPAVTNFVLVFFAMRRHGYADIDDFKDLSHFIKLIKTKFDNVGPTAGKIIKEAPPSMIHTSSGRRLIEVIQSVYSFDNIRAIQIVNRFESFVAKTVPILRDLIFVNKHKDELIKKDVLQQGLQINEHDVALYNHVQDYVRNNKSAFVTNASATWTIMGDKCFLERCANILNLQGQSRGLFIASGDLALCMKLLSPIVDYAAILFALEEDKVLLNGSDSQKDVRKQLFLDMFNNNQMLIKSVEAIIPLALEIVKLMRTNHHP